MKDSTLTAIRTVLGPMTSEAKCREVYEAVLLSVRELNEAQRAASWKVERGHDEYSTQRVNVGDEEAEPTWRALIDALLAE